MKTSSSSAEDSLPTSPSGKKVCFADLVGLKLERVKVITPCSSEDNIGAIVEAFRNNKPAANDCDINGNVPLWKSVKCLCPCFIQPSKSVGFLERVHRQNVCLEDVACANFVVTGIIRVTNLAFIKEVTVRFSLDDWATFRDIWADYLSSCSDGKTDKFSFRITVPLGFEVGRRLEFAVRYLVTGQEFWDNNFKLNYQIECLKVFPETF